MKVITSNPVITGTLKTFEDGFESNDSGFNGMTIKTTDPIINGSLKTFEDGFASNNSGFNGLTVISENPVLTNVNYVEDDWLSSVSGATRRARRASKKSASGDTFINKVGKGLNRLADSGIVDSLRNLRNPQEDIVIDDFPLPPTPAPTPDKSMSMGVKVAIGIGVAVIIGSGILYFMKSGKKKAIK